MAFFSISSYFEHKDTADFILAIIFLALGFGAIWLGGRLSSGISSPYNLFVTFAPVFAVALAYIAAYGIIRGQTSMLINENSSDFKMHPDFEGKVGERLVDSWDVKILDVIRSEGGNYSSFIPEALELLSVNELFRRLGRLHALDYIRIYKNRINMTPSGLDLLTLPPISLQGSIPPKIASKIAQSKMKLGSGQFKEVIAELSIMLELLLRQALETSPNANPEKLKEINPKPYDKWTLGELKAAAAKLGLCDSISENMLDSAVQLRNRSLHASTEGQPPKIDTFALTFMDLCEAFIRYWYSRQR